MSYEEASGSSGAGYRYTPDPRHIDRALAAYGLEAAKPVAAPGVKDGGTKLGNALNTLAEGGDDKVRRFSVPKVSRSISAVRPRLSLPERGPTAR